jgi:uncharacterized protein (DUF1800 family)
MATDLLKPLSARDWNETNARHLLRRAGFGVPAHRAAELAKMGPAEAVDQFINYEKFPQASPAPDWLEPITAEGELRRQVQRIYEMNLGDREPTEEEKQRFYRERQKLVNELNAEERRDIERLKGWWLRRMLTGQRPLEEKMALFWHGHFATSAQKVKSGYANYQLNKLFRERATGNFKMLAYEVGVTPAMMRYLDNGQNRKGRPNENWARELMELFTLGVGNYTEDDIKEAARAFTGWSADGEDFAYRPNLHDEGEKVFMGKRGNLNGNDIVDVIFEQPAASRFITTKLWGYFAYENPEPEIIESLAATFRDCGFELKPVLEQMFRSEAFYSEKALNTRIKSPAELTVSMLGTLDIQPEGVVEAYCLQAMRLMGQDLFYPPNVKGWPGGKLWINTNTLMARYNLSNFLVQGVATELRGRGIQDLVKQTRRSMAKKPRGKKGQVDTATMADDGSDEMMGMDVMEGAEVGMVGDTEGPKGFKLPVAPFKAEAFFNKAKGTPVAKVADLLADHFYGMPIREDQREKVVQALAGTLSPQTPLDPDKWDEGRLRGAVHLMLSTAEFQLC